MKTDGSVPTRWTRAASFVRRHARLAALVVAVATVVFIGIHQYVITQSNGRIFGVDDVPARPVAIVLGAKVYENSIPSPMLMDRLRTAAELYANGKVAKVIVSGDHGRHAYNEVRVMAATLEDLGVPEQDIFLDHAGFRTLDSLVRAKQVFGVDQAIVVSNPFHIPRAVFLGLASGIDIVGVGADYGMQFTMRTRLRIELREAVARVVSFGDVCVYGRGPRFLGDPIDIAGDGRVTRDVVDAR